MAQWRHQAGQGGARVPSGCQLHFIRDECRMSGGPCCVALIAPRGTWLIVLLRVVAQTKEATQMLIFIVSLQIRSCVKDGKPSWSSYFLPFAPCGQTTLTSFSTSSTTLHFFTSPLRPIGKTLTLSYSFYPFYLHQNHFSHNSFPPPSLLDRWLSFQSHVSVAYVRVGIITLFLKSLLATHTY